MEEDRNREPGERFRSILSSKDEETNAQPQPNSQPQSPLEKLPRLKPSPQVPPIGDMGAVLPKSKVPDSSTPLSKLPQGKQSVQPESKELQQPEKTVKPQGMQRREKFLRALWTTTSLISMAVNIVAIIVIIVLFWAYRSIKVPESIDVTMANKLLSGLYSNFELMDDATISTNIPVNDEIPVQFDLEINQLTTVTLSEDVTIRGAYVVINTPVIDINAPAVVTLPAGTDLPIILNLIVPVDKQVPVNLNVAVDIPLNETELHTPFVGLQEVVKPLYCLVEPAAASSLTGDPVCK